MTSLAAQLQSLQTAQTDLYDPERKHVSILFSAIEARKISSDTYYKIGYKGFKNLCSHDCSFEEFICFFNDKSQSIQRAILPAKDNEKLDEQIERFLICLGPYLERESALQSLEWLVRRFQVHEMNVDSFMSCILPYFETHLFIRLLQVVNLKSSRTWDWLKHLQDMGRPLTKSNLFRQWSSNEWFRNFVANTFMKQMKIVSTSNLQAYAVFFILTVDGGLSVLNKVTETHLTTIVRTMDVCLHSGNSQATGGMAFLLMSLSTLATLSDSFIHKILDCLCNEHQLKGKMAKQMVACTISIVHEQNVKILPDSINSLVLNNKVLFKEICAISLWKNVFRFLSAFLCGVIRFLFSGKIAEEDIPENFNRVIQLLEEANLTTIDAKIVLNTFVKLIQERIDQFRNLKSCPNFEEMFTQLDIYQPACVPHNAVSNLLTDTTEKNEYLARNTQIDKKKRTDREELKADVNLIMENSLLHVKQLHLIREGEYEKNLLDIVNALHFALKWKKAKPRYYDKIVTALLSKTLKTDYSKLNFLSIIWSSNSNSIENLDSSVKKWALITATDILKDSTQESINWMLNPKETFIPSLFLPICEDKNISILTFHLMEDLYQMMGPTNGHRISENFQPLVREILSYKKEIIDDTKFLPQAIQAICKKNAGCLHLLKNIISDEVVPMRIKSSLLYSVSNFTNFKTLLSFVPLANEILDRSKLLNGILDHDMSMCLYYVLIRIPDCKVEKIADSDVSPLVIRCIQLPDQVINANGKLFAPQELVFNKDFILRTSECDSFFLNVLTAVIDLTEHTGNVAIATKFRKLLSTTSVSGHVILKLLDMVKLVCTVSDITEPMVIDDDDDSDASDTPNNPVYLDLAPWKKLQFIVELIGILGHIKQSWILIAPLFNYLKLSIRELSLNTMTSNYTDTFHQRLLTIIQHLLEMSEKSLSSKEIHDKVKIDFTLLVQLMSATENPDTRRRVLMILSLSTIHFPDEIIQNAISIFVFMRSTLKMDDTYSIDVIHKTMDTILPPLINSTKSNPENINSKLFQIVKVFVKAFPNMPAHRRLPLYLQLAHNIGTDNLWLLMVATVEVHVFEPKFHSKKEPNFHFGNLTPLWESIFRHFPVLDRLNTIKRVVDFLVDIPEDQDSMMRQQLNLHLRILQRAKCTSQKLHQLKYTCVQMLLSFLMSSQLAKEINRIRNDQLQHEFSSVYHIILEVSIPYLKKVSDKGTNSQDTKEKHYWQKLEQKMSDLVKVMFELMPPHLLIKVILNLVWSDDMVRYRALEVVAEKLHPQSNFFSEEHTEDASKFIKFLIESGSSKDTPNNVRQVSLFTLHSVLKTFGNDIDNKLLLSVLKSSVKILKSSKINIDIKLQSVLVAVEGIVILQDDAIGSLDDIISFILKKLQSVIIEENKKINSSLHILTSSLQRITKVLPHHLGDHLSIIINIICGLFYYFETCKSSELINCLALTKSQVLSIEPYILLDNMKESYFNLLSENTKFLPIFFQHLSVVLSEQELDGLFSNLRSLQRLFSLSLQVRTAVDCPDQIDGIEDSFFNSVSEFLMRCDEQQCRDNFKYLKKKCTKHASLQVTVTFYKFCSYLASSLNVVFISLHLFDQIFDSCIEILSNNNTISSEEMFNDDNYILVNAVLDIFHHVFAHDSIEYMNRGRLTACMSPIINQIDNIMGGSEVYKNRISNHLKPCIALLTTVCKDDDVWGDINKAVLCRIKTSWKNNSNLVILGTLEVFEGIVEESGSEFIQSQLGDIMVYIAEAMEITDHEVQTKTKQIFSKLEETLGESLRSYLGS